MNDSRSLLAHEEAVMTTVSSSITINQPVEKVFSMVADPANQKSLNPGVLDVKLTPPGPVAVGSLLHYTTEYAGKKYESAVQVSAYEPNKKWATKTTGTPKPMETVYSFEAAGAGTKLTISVELIPGSYPAPAEPTIKAQWQKTLDETSGRLKQMAEK
jgi:carbon monoxide dehydrogenase subunit G